MGRVGHLIFKRKMPESFAQGRCLDHLMRNSMRKAPCRCLAKFCAKLLKPISRNHCPTRHTRPTRPTSLSASREAQSLALHCSLQSVKLCEMGLCAPCRGAPAVVLRFSCQRSNWLIPLPLSKCASTPSKRAELVMGERCCAGRPEGGTAFRRLRPLIAQAITSRPYTGR